MTTSIAGSKNGDLFAAPTAATTSPRNFPVIRLEIRGVGNPTSFKNQKQIIQLPIKGSQKCPGCGKRPGRPMLITKKERKEQMDQIIQNLVHQLSSMYQTIGDETLTECYRQSLTALFEQSIPFDDRWQILPEVSVRVEKVNEGEEGATIELTLLL